MTEKNNGKWIASIAVVLGAIGGSTGGSYVYIRAIAPQQLETLARPDPFTGSEALELRRELRELQLLVAKLPPEELTSKLAALERDVELLRKQLDEHKH
ncbi:MAG: hypothetical protein ACR2PS_05550 [Pseudomonadales bacterium]